jgi:hypothetical protein
MPITRVQLSKIGQILVVLGLAVGAPAAVTWIFLLARFAQSPTHRDGAHGNTALWINHGFQHYVNPTELDLFNTMSLVGVPLYLMFMFVALWMYRGSRAVLRGR